MHRSRLSVLVIFAAAAACSTHDDASTADLLSRDPSLVARLEADREPPRSPLPGVCDASAAVAPSSTAKSQAAELTRRAYDAELLGNVAEARSLLRNAIALDGTNMSAAYHLGRTSETLGDRAGATSAYCRYLTLSPTTTESAEVRQRVMGLSSAAPAVAAGNVTPHVTTRARARIVANRRATREQTDVAPRTSSRRQVTSVASANGDVITTSTPMSSDDGSPELSPVTSPTTSPASTRSQRRSTSRVQSAGIGAMAGAILGAATGRSVKSAMIGAAAGGILGTVVTHGSRAGG